MAGRTFRHPMSRIRHKVDPILQNISHPRLQTLPHPDHQMLEMYQTVLSAQDLATTTLRIGSILTRHTSVAIMELLMLP